MPRYKSTQILVIFNSLCHFFGATYEYFLHGMFFGKKAQDQLINKQKKHCRILNLQLITGYINVHCIYMLLHSGTEFRNLPVRHLLPCCPENKNPLSHIWWQSTMLPPHGFRGAGKVMNERYQNVRKASECLNRQL